MRTQISPGSDLFVSQDARIMQTITPCVSACRGLVRCDAYLMSVYKLLFEWFVFRSSRPVCGSFDLNILRGGISNAFNLPPGPSQSFLNSKKVFNDFKILESLGKNLKMLM